MDVTWLAEYDHMVTVQMHTIYLDLDESFFLIRYTDIDIAAIFRTT